MMRKMIGQLPVQKIEVTGRGAGFPDKLGPVAEAFTEKINDDVTQTELSSADRQ